MRTPFIDREAELEVLSGLAERGSGVPIYLYGPEGCGKTRLLRELVTRLRGRSGYLVAYIDALEDSDLGRAVIGSRELHELFLRVVKGSAEGPIGALLAYAAARVLAVAERRLVEGRHVVLVVDDVARQIGLENIEAYLKKLLKLIEYDLAEKNPASVLVIASTSEGLSLERIRRHPTWASIRLLWSLPREGFQELASLLSPPGRDVVEEAWLLTGGNPRALIEIATAYQWRLSTWLRDLEANIIAPVVAEARARGLLSELARVAENPDTIVSEPSPSLNQLARILVEHNLLIYKASSTITGATIPASPELGIGEYYAWQLPAYHVLLQRRTRL